MISNFIDEFNQPTLVVNKTAEEQELEQQAPVTDVHIHKGEHVSVIHPQYLVNIYPETLNQLSVAKGVIFRYHFLSKSLHFWIEIVESQIPDKRKLCKSSSRQIRQLLYSQNNFFFKLWADRIGAEQQYQSRKKFEKDFKAPGKSLKIFEKAGKKFEIAYIGGNEKQLEEFRKRFEFFMVFFIDGVSSVDTVSDEWGYYVIYQLDEENQRHFAGVLSKYIFRIIFAKERDRISQVVILPHYQNIGLGGELLNQVYDDCFKRSSCIELTVEGPSTEFQCLRLSKQAQFLIKSGIFNTELINNFPLKTAEDIRELVKIYLTQQNIEFIKKNFKLPGQEIESIANIIIFSRALGTEDSMIQAHFDEYLRQKILRDFSHLRHKEVVPYLFIEGQNVDMKDYNILRSKQEFLIKSSGGVEEQLRETLDIYRRVSAKLRKQKLVGNKEQEVQRNKEQEKTSPESVK